MKQDLVKQEEAEQDANDNLEFEESVNQTDWLNQDNYLKN